MLLAWTLVPPVLCFVTFPLVHLFLARYLQFTAPAWCLLAGAGLYAASRTLSRHPELRWTKVVLAAPMVALIAWVSIPGQMQARPVALTWEPDFRAAASTLARNARAGDAIAYAGVRGGRLARPTNCAAVTGRSTSSSTSRRRPSAGTGRSTAPTPFPCLGRTDQIWLVSTTPAATPFTGMPAARADLLRRLFTIVETHSHHQVQLLLLVRTS